MTIEFKWAVQKVQVAENNLITSVDLIVTAIDENNSLTTSATYSRNLIRGDSFIPYEQLTEQQVLNWCFEPEVIVRVDSENVEQSTVKHLQDEGEAQVTSQIAFELAQKQSTPALPWA